MTAAFQTQVPAELRARYNVQPGDLVVWDELDDDRVAVRFRRRYTIEDMVGLLGPGGPGGDAVRDKKRAQRGEL